jgi:outer membrane lipoprotein SlyB
MAACVVVCLTGCGPDYSPNTYSATAVQQANKVEKGVVVGVRQIAVSAQGVVGTATGAAAGGVLGAQAGGGPVTSTFGALGLVGGLIGSSVEHATGDTNAYEYIVRKPNNELVSVTQKDPVALALGQHVLVIAGSQARIVPDYTVNPEVATAPPVTAGSLSSPATPPPAPRPPAPPPAATPPAPADGPAAGGMASPAEPPPAAAASAAAPTPLLPPSLAPAAPSPGTTGTEPPPVPVSAAPLSPDAPAAAAQAPAATATP